MSRVTTALSLAAAAHRAGWYTPYWLDRTLFGIRTRSADEILPRFQNLAIGDRVSDSERGHSYFTAAIVEPPSVLVLHSNTHPLPLYDDTAFTWAFIAGDHVRGTRLIVRARIAYRPVWPAGIVRALITVGFGIGDVIQAGGMLKGIRARAERGVRSDA